MSNKARVLLRLIERYNTFLDRGEERNPLSIQLFRSKCAFYAAQFLTN